MSRRPTVIYRTIPSWPDPETPRNDRLSHYSFKATAYSTQQLLESEAHKLRASDLIVEVVGTSELFYKDGTGIRSDRARQVAHVGVVVHLIGTRFGDLRYSCDRFTAWEANLRAVALGLEALRKVERYGIARRGEQYAGWAALPPGTPLGARAVDETITVDDAARLLSAGMDGIEPKDVLEHLDVARTCYRVAAKRLHPDNLHTGNADSFRRLNVAYELLVEHHGGEA